MARGWSAPTPSGFRLLHAQTVHKLADVGKGWHIGTTAAAAAAAGCVAVERPVADKRQAIGQYERVNGVDVVLAGDFVLGISPPDHHRDSNMVKRNAGLL